jgi:hypothetical protein
LQNTNFKVLHDVPFSQTALPRDWLWLQALANIHSNPATALAAVPVAAMPVLYRSVRGGVEVTPAEQEEVRGLGALLHLQMDGQQHAGVLWLVCQALAEHHMHSSNRAAHSCACLLHKVQLHRMTAAQQSETYVCMTAGAAQAAWQDAEPPHHPQVVPGTSSRPVAATRHARRAAGRRCAAVLMASCCC